MKRRFIAIVIGLLTLSWACSDDDDNQIPVIEPEAQGVFKGVVEYEDEELEIEFPWVRYGNLEWMTTNLNIDISVDRWSTSNGCEISHDPDRNPIDMEIEKKQNYETFGCLYTYEKASILCPEGWRIPTDEDWQSLEKAMGMSNTDLNATDWRGNPVGTLLQEEEGSMINLRTGGMGDNDGFYFTYVYGFYWTATPEAKESNLHYCRQISYNSGKIARLTIDKGKMLSVRFVRDAK